MKRICKGMLCLILALSILAGMAIPAMATELKTGIGIVTTSCLRLRAKPNTDSEVIGKAYYGDAVVIIREVDDWYLVNCNLEIGYMHKDYLDLRERKNVRLGYASFDAVTNIRKGPGTDTAIVDQAPKGDVCFIIGFNCEWYKVTYEGQTGYVRSDLLTLLEKPYDNYGSPGNTYHEASTSAKTSTTAASSSTSTSSSSSSSSSASSSSSSTSSSSTSSSSTSSSAAASTLGEQMVAYAKNFLGYRYVWGGKDPSTGFDCSGLTWYVAKHFGIRIGRSANDQLSYGTYVSRADLKPGDIVLFERTYTSSVRATHAGMYIGNGQFIHAANSRVGVVISSLSETYYSSRFICGRRLG